MMHALENFEGLSAQGQSRGLGAKANNKAKDFKNILEDPRGQGRVITATIGYCKPVLCNNLQRRCVTERER